MSAQLYGNHVYEGNICKYCAGTPAEHTALGEPITCKANIVGLNSPAEQPHHLSTLELTRRLDELQAVVKRLKQGIATVGDMLLPQAISELATMKQLAEERRNERANYDQLILRRINDLDRRIAMLEHENDKLRQAAGESEQAAAAGSLDDQF